MKTNAWFPWYSREWMKIPLARRTYSNWAGSYYQFARDDNGRVIRFWTRKSAQEYADFLNQNGAGA